MKLAAAALLVSLFAAATTDAADRPPLIAAKGDAFVSHADDSDAWSIGSATLEVGIAFDASHTLSLQRIFNPATGRAWNITPAPEFSITASGERLSLTSNGAVTFVNAVAATTEHGVTLTFNFEHRGQRLQIARVYASYPGSPTIETWTRVTSAGSGSNLTDLSAWNMTMPLGNVRWLGGLNGDSANSDSAVEGAFIFAEHDFEPGERLDLGADGRSSERFVPLFLVDDGRDEFYGGLMWSGAWQASLERADDRLRVAVSFPGVGTAVTPARPFELPHTFFGVAAKATIDETGALRQFVLQGIRHGRPFKPLVTYNTWFAYGTRVDEETMVAEIDRAASLGVELVVMDAGWYLGAGAHDDFDFDAGLGSWAADPERFPSGLASLSDYAHGSGLKFGIWVEPERVSLATVDDQVGLAHEAWLATHAGDYGSAANAQICLAGATGRKWLMDKLVALIDSVRPDYLKWDNNFWINCDRTGHGHGLNDGNMSHVQALYGMLDELRTRYPDLMIENVSGGGSRLDFGMMAYTDTAWMDDRTSPASHVRHNIEGLTFAFPPAYLLSFLIDADGEPIAGADDLPMLFRSRTPGILGLTYRTAALDDDTAALLAQQIAQYKTYRDIITQSNATLLTAQAPVAMGGWDVLQELTDDARTALIFGVKSDTQDGRFVVRPRGLVPDAVYDVQSLDVGPLGAARGDSVMVDGVELIHSGGSRAHVLILRAR